MAADPVVQYMGAGDLQKLITETQRNMEAAAKDLDFLEAARYRDAVLQLKERLKGAKWVAKGPSRKGTEWGARFEDFCLLFVFERLV